MRRSWLFASSGLLLLAVGCQSDSNAVYVDHLAILNINPSHGAVKIGYDTDVTVTFSQVLQPQTINNQTFCLASGSAADPVPCGGTDVVSSTVTYDAQTLTATLVPSAALLPDTRYNIRVTGGVSSDLGALPVTIEASFRTIPTFP